MQPDEPSPGDDSQPERGGSLIHWTAQPTSAWACITGGYCWPELVDGWPEQAVMYFPAIDELYYAQRDQGAFLNHEPLHIRPAGANRPRTFFACCSRTHRRYQVSVPYKARILGCAAYTLCTVARSSAILGFESTASIWDLAAPWLVVCEAGGIVETLDGSQPFPLIPEMDYSNHKLSNPGSGKPGGCKTSSPADIAQMTWMV